MGRLLYWPQSPQVGVFLCLPRQAGPRTMISRLRREGGMRPQHSCLIHVSASVLWLTIVWGLACLPSRSLAQPSPGAGAPLQLAPVEVRGQRLGVEQIVRETSTFATTIDTSEATAKVQSVADVLSESVGVQVRRFGGLGAFSTVSIRGSTPNQVEVYLDNVLLNTANAGLVDLGSVPLDNVDHIEIYRGFAPLQLGAGSIGGAINLVTALRQVSLRTAPVRHTARLIRVRLPCTVRRASTGWAMWSCSITQKVLVILHFWMITGPPLIR